MPDSLPLVDIHCHLIAELDDGPATWEQSVAMARLAVADGISTIIATPHQLDAHARNRGEVVRARTAQLQQLLRQNGVPLRVLPGGEVRIEPELVRRIRADDALTLADRRQHVLLELPHEVYFPLDRLLMELRSAGIVPILAHPERNGGILAQPHLLDPLVRAGCLLQVTAGSLTGSFGPQVQKLAQGLVQRGLVQLVATDAHGSTSRRPLLSRAFQVVAQLAGQQAAVDLCCRNPASIAAGRPLAPPAREPHRAPAAGWFRWRRAG